MYRIWIVALGIRTTDLTLGALDRLRQAGRVLLKSARYEAAEWLRGEGIPFDTLDSLYESADSFDELDEAIVMRLRAEAAGCDVAYAVSDLRDTSVARLLTQADLSLELVPGVPLEGELAARGQSETNVISASDWAEFEPDSSKATMIREIDTRELAGELKLRLMRRYPEAHDVWLHTGDGLSKCPLYELDQLERYDHRLCAYMPPVESVTALDRFGFEDLNRVVRVLRGPNGCAWDREQTHKTLRQNVVEEAHEVVEAIDGGDPHELYDELGDVLLQVSLHAEIARQHGEFDIDDVTTAICKKLISRHPHIFAHEQADTPDQVLSLWQRVKKKEKQLDTQSQVMRAVTKSLPALMRAEKVQKRAADVRFDWSEPLDALHKIREETDEVEHAIRVGEGTEEELGDLLFAVVNVARLSKVCAENALMAAIDKFIGRFEQMEQRILSDGKSLESMTFEQMDEYWDRVKRSRAHESAQRENTCKECQQ